MRNGQVGLAVHQHGEILPLGTVLLVEPLTRYVSFQYHFLRAIDDLSTLCQWLSSGVLWKAEPLDVVELARFWLIGVQVIRGEPASIPIRSVSLETSPKSARVLDADPTLERGQMRCHTTLKVNAWDEEVGEIPVELDMAGYRLERAEDGGLVMRPRGESGAAAILRDASTSEL